MTALLQEIADLIREEGPITIERYMALCLGHPRHGYYMTRDPFGASGDFTTAPEVSQIFGELLGLWVAEVWTAMGAPPAFRLVELGPGRGTLMADALRALRIVPACLAASSVHLIETSPVLSRVQADRLTDAGVPLAWHATLDEVPAGPAVVVANEFLDALPVRQFQRTGTGWHERMVGLDGDRLTFGLWPEPEPGLGTAGQPGDILEIAERAARLVRELASRLAQEGGAALLLDYGHLRSGPGETLQAMKRHAFVDLLAEPGEADLTVHVDFDRVAREAARAGAGVHGPVTQAAFLRGLGIEARAAVLARKASPSQAREIASALERLAGTEDGQMGELFKVIGLADPSLPDLPALPRMPATTILEPAAC